MASAQGVRRRGLGAGGGFTVTPAASATWRRKFLSTQPVTQTAGSSPFYILPVGSQGLAVDKWGNIRGGPNELIPEAVWSGSTQVTANSVGSVFDFAYLAHQRRIYSRHAFLTEVDNPANVQLGRIDAGDHYPYPTTDGTQYGTPDYTKFQGVTATQTLGKIVFRGAVAQFPNGAGGLNATFQQESVEVYAYAAEDFIQTANGNHFATGGELYFMTRPTGDSTGLAGSEAKPDRFGMNAIGVVGVMGLTVGKGELKAAHLARGDFVADNNVYGTADVVARQSVVNAASAVTTRLGAIGPGGEGGVKFGTAPVALLYGSAASGGVNVLVASTSLRANFLALHSTGSASNRIRSNYLPSTDRLSDTAAPSWNIALGDSDRVEIFRAPATAGAPAYASLVTISSAGLLTATGVDVSGNLRLIGSASQIVAQSGSASNTVILVARAAADTANRFQLRVSGVQEWGDGTNPADVALRRNSAGILSIRNTADSADLSLTALNITSSGVFRHTGTTAGFFGVAAAARPSLTYSRGGAGETAAVAAIRGALATLGLVADNTVA